MICIDATEEFKDLLILGGSMIIIMGSIFISVVWLQLIKKLLQRGKE